MAEYIDKHKAYLMLKDLEAAYIYPPVKEAYATAARRIDQMPAADVLPVNMFMSDRCIVCYRDVRKDTAYYDINGATVCEGCMGVQCKVNNPIKEQEG